MRICYHGTSKQNARSILKEGFRPDTWFARNLQDAVGFGGSHVFEVVFDSPPDHWQFHVPKKIKPDRIVRYMIYKRKLIFKNAELSGKIFSSNND